MPFLGTRAGGAILRMMDRFDRWIFGHIAPFRALCLDGGTGLVRTEEPAGVGESSKHVARIPGHASSPWQKSRGTAQAGFRPSARREEESMRDIVDDEQQRGRPESCLPNGFAAALSRAFAAAPYRCPASPASPRSRLGPVALAMRPTRLLPRAAREPGGSARGQSPGSAGAAPSAKAGSPAGTSGSSA